MTTVSNSSSSGRMRSSRSAKSEPTNSSFTCSRRKIPMITSSASRQLRITAVVPVNAAANSASRQAGWLCDSTAKRSPGRTIDARRPQATCLMRASSSRQDSRCSPHSTAVALGVWPSCRLTSSVMSAGSSRKEPGPSGMCDPPVLLMLCQLMLRQSRIEHCASDIRTEPIDGGCDARDSNAASARWLVPGGWAEPYSAVHPLHGVVDHLLDRLRVEDDPVLAFKVEHDAVTGRQQVQHLGAGHREVPRLLARVPAQLDERGEHRDHRLGGVVQREEPRPLAAWTVHLAGCEDGVEVLRADRARSEGADRVRERRLKHLAAAGIVTVIAVHNPRA